MIRPFRFGVQASSAADRGRWTALARRVEANGYGILTMPDHFDDQLAPVPASDGGGRCHRHGSGSAHWCGTTTTSIRSCWRRSSPRSTCCRRAGWRSASARGGWQTDYDAVRHRLRLDQGPRRPVRRSARGDQGSVGGRRRSRTRATTTRSPTTTARPKPVQRPWPPILIGGGGKRVLSIAAREADIVGINGTLTAGVVGPEAIATMTADAVDAKVAIVRDGSRRSPRRHRVEHPRVHGQRHRRPRCRGRRASPAPSGSSRR